MAKALVIVESPAKAKTINKYLGKQYVVKASLGHIKDLPKKDLAVDVANGFEPRYESRARSLGLFHHSYSLRRHETKREIAN